MTVVPESLPIGVTHLKRVSSTQTNLSVLPTLLAMIKIDSTVIVPGTAPHNVSVFTCVLPTCVLRKNADCLKF